MKNLSDKKVMPTNFNGETLNFIFESDEPLYADSYNCNHQKVDESGYADTWFCNDCGELLTTIEAETAHQNRLAELAAEPAQLTTAFVGVDPHVHFAKLAETGLDSKVEKTK